MHDHDIGLVTNTIGCKAITMAKKRTLYLHKYTVRFCKKRSIGELPSSHFPQRKQKADYIFMAAAVSDYVPSQFSNKKIKRSNNTFNIDLICMYIKIQYTLILI